MKLKYELILVDKKSNTQKSTEYLKLNPAGRIPTLIDDGSVLFESPAICIHLCEQHSEHHLIPRLGSKERPLFFQWLTYLNNTLQAELMVYYYPHRHTDDENSRSNVVAAQEDRITESLSIINDQLEGNSYLLGEYLTACDFFLFMLAEWSLPIKKSALHYPHLTRYLRCLSQLPTVKTVCELENIYITPFK